MPELNDPKAVPNPGTDEDEIPQDKVVTTKNTVAISGEAAPLPPAPKPSGKPS